MRTEPGQPTARQPARNSVVTEPARSCITHHASAVVPIRLLTAVPICDGHDSAINTINLEFIRHGIEVIYLGYHRSARDIVRAAIQEDVRAIGLSSYNGGHVEFFTEVLQLLRKNGADDVGVFGGGGGTITRTDANLMKRRGVAEIFFAGTPLDELVKFVQQAYGRPRPRGRSVRDRDHLLARLLSEAESGKRPTSNVQRPTRNELEFEVGRRTSDVGRSAPCLGITGPGGAGKTTLIDELVLRLLNSNPKARLAILSHDPSVVGKGALLGDRATMIYSQDDRVFMRSLATRGRTGGLASATERCLQILKHAGFDLVLIESVGVGQEALPFTRALVDKTVLVMSPDYGSRLQLQKIVMLDTAEIVVINKSDLAGARTASTELEHRLAANQRGQKLIATVAKRHRDPGVDELFREVAS